VAQSLAADADALAATSGCAARNAAVKLQADVICPVSSPNSARSLKVVSKSPM